MKILADENFPGFAVRELRKAGHDVFWARTEMPGAGDQDLLGRASEEGRVLLTFDKDFGELAFRYGLRAPCGIVLFRIEPASAAHVAEAARALLEFRTDWEGRFAIVEPGRVRWVPLPSSVDLERSPED